MQKTQNNYPKNTPGTSDNAKFVGCKIHVQQSTIFYIPAMNKWNLKLKTQYHLH